MMVYGIFEEPISEGNQGAAQLFFDGPKGSTMLLKSNKGEVQAE
jgi:hypothetical protein